MQKKTYSKPFLDVDQQIALFAARGLAIDVPLESAASYLSTVNYYRFTGYSIPFQMGRGNQTLMHKELDAYT